MIRTLELFAGIGGIGLGLERTGGFQVVGQCEIDLFCRQVLAKHWPHVWRHDDVTTLTGELVRQHCGAVRMITGGFPCQDISQAGKREGIDGKRSGLWSEYLRLICELRPDYVFVENVSALLVRGFGRVLGDLASCGYDAEWQCIPAASVGAPHIRDRVWILAYARQECGGIQNKPGSISTHMLPQGDNGQKAERREDRELVSMVPGIHPRVASDWWESQSRMARSAHGISDWMDRCGSLGNGVVPQIAEWIGNAILHAEASR